MSLLFGQYLKMEYRAFFSRVESAHDFEGKILWNFVRASIIHDLKKRKIKYFMGRSICYNCDKEDQFWECRNIDERGKFIDFEKHPLNHFSLQ